MPEFDSMFCFKILHLKPALGVWSINRERFVSYSNNQKHSLKRKHEPIKKLRTIWAEEMGRESDDAKEAVAEVVDENNLECDDDEDTGSEGGNEEIHH